MQNELKMEDLIEEKDSVEGLDEELDGELKISQKKSKLSRLRGFFSKKKVEQPEEQKSVDSTASKLTKKETAESIRKINDFLGVLENQLDKVDGQNKTLIDQLTKLKADNETLLKQINMLTDNNTKLTNQFNAMKRREKTAKILAIISAILAIGLSAYNIIKLIIQ